MYKPESDSNLYFYFAYGLFIKSEIKLPALISSAERRADISIRLGTIQWTPPNIEAEARCVTEVHSGTIHYFWPSVGKFLSLEGREIIAEPRAGVEENLLGLLILGAVLAGTLHQRGLLLLHASAVKVGDSALVFMGPKGQGKSTLAASLQTESGCAAEMLADDIVAISVNGSGPVVLPGFPQFRLWPDAADSLGIHHEKLSELHPQLEKRGYRVAANFQSSSVPLRRLFILDHGDSLMLEHLTPHAAFFELTRHSYLGRHIPATGLAMQHFKQCTAIASSVTVTRLKRPRSLQLLRAASSLIVEEIIRSEYSASREVYANESEAGAPKTLGTGA